MPNKMVIYSHHAEQNGNFESLRRMLSRRIFFFCLVLGVEPGVQGILSECCVLLNQTTSPVLVSEA